MKTITKKYFMENILNSNPPGDIPDNSIQEVRIGKDFAYSIDKKFESYSINKRLTSLVFNKVPLNDSAVAFRQGMSYYDFMFPHKNNYKFLRLDVKSYFHSLRIRAIRNCLKHYFMGSRLTNNTTMVDQALKYCTYTIPTDSKNVKFSEKVVLPIGFPSSPVISNIIFRQLDIEIQKICYKHEIIYTRYADDMLFSAKKSNIYIHNALFEEEISRLLQRLSLKLNNKKTLKKNHTLSLNGNVIAFGKAGGSLRLSNKKVKLINKVTYLALVKEESAVFIMNKLFNVNINNYNFQFQQDEIFFKKVCMDQLFNKAVGYRSYLLSIIQFDKKNNCLETRYRKKYSKIITRLDKLIDIYS
ncbi:reverse transcriptase domain-containing protein [Pseudoalteromonas sp. NZS37]|uniref:reverse transcriptase domain-containing protein n=1 Tax=Pseudoalteromonas sp. NZS37 TaxID=2792071 RepID=UPI0018CC85BA|nr:reverse transcriptase domain-containing protein [Pseudoalteromonas sp. NZS37]MBG9990824.1 hypothetical protein [Pseudoalteromonas sp. NZS37]